MEAVGKIKNVSETNMLIWLELNTLDLMWSKLKREKSYKEALILLEIQLIYSFPNILPAPCSKHMKHSIHLENNVELWVVIM